MSTPTTSKKNQANFIEKITYNDIIEMINYLDGYFLTTFYYYDTFASLQTLLQSPTYSFTHPGMREWWLDYHSKNYDPKWGNFLLGMRSLRSIDINRHYDTKLIVEQIVYLNESTYLFKDFNRLVYLLSLKHSTQFYTNLLISNDFLSICDVEIFKTLIKLGADYNACLTSFSNAPFICVLARLGQIKLLSELIKIKNLNEETVFNYEDKKGTNCLCYATQYDRFECAKFLVENNAHPFKIIIKMDTTGYCALTYASESKRDLKHFLEYYLMQLIGNSLLDVKFLFVQSFVLVSLNSNVNCLNYMVRLF